MRTAMMDLIPRHSPSLLRTGDQDGWRRGYRRGHRAWEKSSLTAAGTGEVIYNIAAIPADDQDNLAMASTDNEVNEEWVKLPVTFVWEVGRRHACRGDGWR